VLVAGLVGLLWLRAEVRGSLAQLDGERALPGLSAPVAIERDALGVPTIHAASRVDAARALGFLHGQDRFFQMDLMRRKAAGELSELFGPLALPADRPNRLHRFRDEARQVLARSATEEHQLLDAYAAGVNAGLAGLSDKPFEYIPLRVSPAPWKPEDTVLVVLAMYMELQDQENHRESERGMMQEVLPPDLYAFLNAGGTEWDAPIEGAPIPTPPIPATDLRGGAQAGKAAFLAPAAPAAPWIGDEELAPGSNNWAVAGAHTADGHALLANDMHLGISVPNTWYRASLVFPDAAGGERRLTGVTLPGTPALVVGSNGHVAWGFTNNYGDWADLVQLEVDPADPEVYRTPEGPKRFTHIQEHIRVKGQPDDILDVQSTIWGPVLGRDFKGRLRALAWTANRPEAVGLRFTAIENARTIEQAMDAANVSGAPAQNFTVADETGRVGWTTMGMVPRRVGFDGSVPTSWADGSHRWDGWLAPGESPRIVDPPGGRIWTANNRVVSDDKLALLGDGGYAPGPRARQIRDDLMALQKATPKDMLAVQLDDRALFLSHWRDLLLRTLNDKAVAGHPQRQEMRRLVETTWDGHASVGSVAYRAVRGFRNFASDRALSFLLAPCRQIDSGFIGASIQREGPVWALLSQRPPHLLDPQYASWDDLLLAAVDDVVKKWEEVGKADDFSHRTWGEFNTTQIRHPLSGAIPLAGRWLDVPSRQLPGDVDMPRVQGPAFGASERLVVSPGQEEKGFFHMPVGQSGNPLSPYYTAGHKAWEEGQPTPFLPGKTEHTLKLTPAG
jgi:penicillin amidase